MEKYSSPHIALIQTLGRPSSHFSKGTQHGELLNWFLPGKLENHLEKPTWFNKNTNWYYIIPFNLPYHG
jgi:hypothetical protein